MPGLQLPAPDTRRLKGSPLELVVCQIRHERNVAVGDAKRALQVRDGLGDKYPVDEEATGLSVNLVGGPTGVATSSDQQQGWNFKSSDGTWTVALMPDFFALETRAYSDWGEFSARLDELVRQVGGSLHQMSNGGSVFASSIESRTRRSHHPPGGRDGSTTVCSAHFSMIHSARP